MKTRITLPVVEPPPVLDVGEVDFDVILNHGEHKRMGRWVARAINTSRGALIFVPDIQVEKIEGID